MTMTMFRGAALAVTMAMMLSACGGDLVPRGRVARVSKPARPADRKSVV